MKKQNSQHGSVLFIILIAVALFGALSFTVSSMMNSGEVNYVSEEKADLYAQELIDYMRKIRETVQFLKISNDCDDTEISFNNDIFTVYAHTPQTRDECKVFHIDGGGLQYIQPSPEMLDPDVSALTAYGDIFFNGATRIVDTGTSDTELIGAVLGIKENICRAINEKLGLGSVTPTDNATGAYFVGSYSASGNPDVGDEASEIAGRRGVCLNGVAGGFNYYAYVTAVIVR